MPSFMFLLKCVAIYTGCKIISFYGIKMLNQWNWKTKK